MQIPLEIRLIIYDFLLSTRPAPDWQWDERSLPQHSHPLYPLLFVNRFLKREISDILYASGTLHFGTAKRCLELLKWAGAHIRLLRALHILVPAYDTYSLEPVFEMLVREKVPLEALKVDRFPFACLATIWGYASLP